MTKNAVGPQEAGDHILPFVATPMPLARSDVRTHIAGRPRVTSLILADPAECFKLLAAGLTLLGRTSAVVRTPFDAIARLQDGNNAVDALFASIQNDASNPSPLFDLLRDEYPLVRRIAFAQHGPWEEGTLSVPLCEHDMILWDPWNRSDFVEILKDALDCRLSRTRSSWTDLSLFESLQGADNLAIAEIVKRYRYRIVRLALDVTHGRMDTEDLVQNAYLAIMRALPMYGRICSPGEWIDRVTCRSIRSFFHGEANEAPLSCSARLEDGRAGDSREQG